MLLKFEKIDKFDFFENQAFELGTVLCMNEEDIQMEIIFYYLYIQYTYTICYVFDAYSLHKILSA